MHVHKGNLSSVVVVLALFAGAAMAQEETGKRVVVANILEVKFAIQKSLPPNLVVTAVGELPTGGYTEAVLSRVVYSKPPADGIQDYVLTAVKPSGIVPQVISRVEASDTLKAYTEAAPWMKGIRVHGVGEGVKEILLSSPGTR
jgi:hypothetical protein